jgi:DNA-binding NarL/FixJ family response regulator
LTAPQISREVFVSKRTVETHLSNAYQKLGVASKIELVSRQAEIGSGEQGSLAESAGAKGRR